MRTVIGIILRIGDALGAIQKKSSINLRPLTSLLIVFLLIRCDAAIYYTQFNSLLAFYANNAERCDQDIVGPR